MTETTPQETARQKMIGDMAFTVLLFAERLQERGMPKDMAHLAAYEAVFYFRAEVLPVYAPLEDAESHQSAGDEAPLKENLRDYRWLLCGSRSQESEPYTYCALPLQHVGPCYRLSKEEYRTVENREIDRIAKIVSTLKHNSAA